jgi:hypothetical protein
MTATRRPPNAARCAAAILGAAVLLVKVTISVPAAGQPYAAGDTDAVLSFIDAAAGRVEVARHWPRSPVDVDVYPFVPYFWSACPGPGAIMILLAAPAVPAGAAASGNAVLERLGGLSAGLNAAIQPLMDATPEAAGELRRLAAGLRTPGDPAAEAVKSFLPLIADLGTYERRGYAVFAFIVWQGWRCGVTVRAVPEGYGIPFVR